MLIHIRKHFSNLVPRLALRLGSHSSHQKHCYALLWAGKVQHAVFANRSKAKGCGWKHFAVCRICDGAHHNPADDAHSVDNWSAYKSLSKDSLPAQTGLNYSDSHSRALRVIARFEQPFSALLLARQRDGEFKRITLNYDIITRLKDIASIRDIRTLEGLQYC
ncbi:uncharacterized protein EDB93DRAFT_340634 [Suillus bovinus]|uniref:uncharacterized protein n=1 Tax=Suillus bovinus TaxID=48563 RepID=UPI001B886D66|nr:uncharacterized protein EDB93DRAFT_340634 [Suillus bovinus]KAG2150242.1 hypothetical protein EDB93DRAFT_340634 [Suillus bovinus]